MTNKWILDTGIITEENIDQLICRYFDGDYYYLAGCTDSYHSGKNDLSVLLPEKANEMLELRIFSDEKELFLFRSMVGHDFNWRVTTDEGLDTYDYMDYMQYIDINSERTYSVEGKKQILSTVGGHYSLPITGNENMVCIRAYIAYDANGIGKVVDHRVCGFSAEQEA